MLLFSSFLHLPGSVVRPRFPLPTCTPQVIQSRLKASNSIHTRIIPKFVFVLERSPEIQTPHPIACLLAPLPVSPSHSCFPTEFASSGSSTSSLLGVQSPELRAITPPAPLLVLSLAHVEGLTPSSLRITTTRVQTTTSPLPCYLGRSPQGPCSGHSPTASQLDLRMSLLCSKLGWLSQFSQNKAEVPRFPSVGLLLAPPLSPCFNVTAVTPL